VKFRQKGVELAEHALEFSNEVWVLFPELAVSLFVMGMVVAKGLNLDSNILARARCLD